MDDFVESLGPAFFAHRLRRLSEALVEDCGAWMPRVGVTSPAKAASTLLLLRAKGPLSVTQIATHLKLSHPLIINLARELEGRDLVRIDQDLLDRRRRPVSLTDAGVVQADRIAEVNRLMARTYATLFADAGVDGLSAIEALERALAKTPLSTRLDDVAFARA